MRWFVAGALLVALIPVGTARRAHADPIDDKRAQAKALQEAIDANGIRIGALSEQYNGAQYHLEQAQAAIADAQQKLDATKADAARLEALIDERAAAAYRGAGQSGPVTLDVSSKNDVIKQSKYSSLATEQDNKLVQELHRAEVALRQQQADAEQARSDAEHERDRIKKAASALEAANARQEQLLSQVTGEIAQLVAEEQARKEAEALAVAREKFAAAAAAPAPADEAPAPAPAPADEAPAPAPAPADEAPAPAPVDEAPATTTAPPTPAAPAPGPPPSAAPVAAPRANPSPPAANVPVNGGGAAAAIAYARAQLGKPYCFAGAGPSCFDCSGLTMRAWGAAGVSMPHYSGAQYSVFPHVPLNAMQPGDLVFWGPGGSQHVGLYIGGGQMIAAPHTGDVVKIQAVWGKPVGAARPR
jgi:peptidoglycan DL-endopeptidase CwlO